MSFRPLHLSKRAFTLFELMIVLMIMALLFAIGLFPYVDVLERAALSNSVDLVAQEWILAHKKVRNGILFEDVQNQDQEEKHAYIVFVFKKNQNFIEWYLLPWAEIPFELSPPQANPFRTITLERGVQIQNFKNTDFPTDHLYYLMAPPYATGTFFDMRRQPINTQEIIITIGYGDAWEHTTRTQDILLRPYLQ